MSLSFSCSRAAATLLLALGLFLARPALAQPCCGEITQAGMRLAFLLDHSGVEHLWLPHTHIAWLTGEPDPARPGVSPTASHCSAFAAAMADRVGIYLLRPPAHGQELLANAQFRWLMDQGAARGWRQVDAREAEALANRGFFVVGVYGNPDPRRPGHIAVIRPSLKSLARLEAEGPQEAQAGAHNFASVAVARGFADHPGAWKPDATGGTRFFAHAVDWTEVPK
jgi:hypothetical protein